MDNNKLFRIILIALLGISALLSVLFAVNVVSEVLLINWCYVLLGIATVLSIVFSIMNMAKNPKKAKNALIGIAGVFVICILGYVMAGDDVITDFSGEVVADSATSKKSGGGLVATYILLIGAIGTIVFAEVSKLFK